MRSTHLGAALAALLTGACVPNQPPPVLTLGDRACVAAPDLATALPVVLKSDSPAKATLDYNTPCLQPPGESRRLYAVFRLPSATAEPFSLSVISQAQGTGVLAPYLVLLDGSGNALRAISHDHFMARGNTLQAGFRPQAGEAYLLVASDPDVVGQETSGIVGNTMMSAVPVGTGGMVYIYTGHETARTTTRAHNGIITVSADPLPKPVSADGKSAQP